MKHNTGITVEAVSAALDRLIYTTASTEAAETLETLLVVQAHWDEPTAPRTPRRNRIALQTLLTQLILSELVARRQGHGLATPNTDAPRPVEEAAIRSDGRCGNKVLLGWSWLYYAYVREDLGITQEAFAKLISVAPKTVQRYQNYALEQLTDRLIALERDARQAMHTKHLEIRLPSPVPVRLYGREGDQQQLEAVCDQRRPAHVQIIGANGVGKTAFVQETIRRAISQNRVDTLVWVDTPSSITDARSRIAQALQTPLSVREYALKYRTFIVLDEVSALAAELDALEALLADLASATVFLIGSTFLPLIEVPARVQLLPLKPSPAQQLILSLLHASYPEEAFYDEDAEIVYEAVGGNPTAIKKLVVDFHSAVA